MIGFLLWWVFCLLVLFLASHYAERQEKLEQCSLVSQLLLSSSVSCLPWEEGEMSYCSCLRREGKQEKARKRPLQGPSVQSTASTRDASGILWEHLSAAQ